jgi:hypothetical protein
MRRSLFLITGTVLAFSTLHAEEDKKPDPRIALDEEFPDPGGASYFGGEITLVEHVNRKGILRLDRDGTINKYFWDLPHHFQMLPYGAIYYHGAPAELRDLPIGTHLHGQFYLGPEGEFEVKPPVSGYVAGKMARPDLRSVETKFSRVFRLEDDFSFYQGQGAGWKIRKIADDRSELTVELVSLKDGSLIEEGREFLSGEQVFRLNAGTQVWKGNGFGSLEDLAEDQVVQINLSWVSLLGSQKQDGLCREIWIDEESRALAAERQRGVHLAHSRFRGVGAKVIQTEHTPGKGAEGHVTIQFHAGIDPGLIGEIVEGKTITVRAAEPSLRTYDSNDGKQGHIKEVERIDPVPAGSSGVEVTFHIYEMFEGLRAGRTIRVAAKDWMIPETPREEKLWPNDLRIFEVGPKHVADRDGPPQGSPEREE